MTDATTDLHTAASLIRDLLATGADETRDLAYRLDLLADHLPTVAAAMDEAGGVIGDCLDRDELVTQLHDLARSIDPDPDQAPAEKCPTCGQPDNCGDCDHTPASTGTQADSDVPTPVTDRDVVAMLNDAAECLEDAPSVTVPNAARVYQLAELIRDGKATTADRRQAANLLRREGRDADGADNGECARLADYLMPAETYQLSTGRGAHYHVVKDGAALCGTDSGVCKMTLRPGSVSRRNADRLVCRRCKASNEFDQAMQALYQPRAIVAGDSVAWEPSADALTHYAEEQPALATLPHDGRGTVVSISGRDDDEGDPEVGPNPDVWFTARVNFGQLHGTHVIEYPATDPPLRVVG